MTEPTYMSRLEHVAQHVAGDVDALNTLGHTLGHAWARFEMMAKINTYDIFAQTDLELEEMASQLCRLLFKVPGADWRLDVAQLQVKDREYGGSWIKRGGAGAFFMLARKWDRVALQLHRHDHKFALVLADERPDGVLDDLGDLRRYLLLCLSYWQVERAVVSVPPEDQTKNERPGVRVSGACMHPGCAIKNSCQAYTDCPYKDSF